MFIRETQCANPWDENQELDLAGDNQSKINKLLTFLNAQGIEVNAVQYDFDDNVIACLECHCLTGGTYYVKLENNEELVKQMEIMGFIRY